MVVEVLNKAFTIAKEYELKNGGCPQCALMGIFEALNIEDDSVFKAATALADGVGLTGDGHCGALSGGVMAISYIFGREKKDFGNQRKLLRANLLAKRLHDEFVEKYGTCRCADIQKQAFGRFFNLYDPEDVEAAIKAGMPEKCSTLVGEVARMAVRIILEENERQAEHRIKPENGSPAAGHGA